jgi:hypothetical protein
VQVNFWKTQSEAAAFERVGISFEHKLGFHSFPNGGVQTLYCNRASRISLDKHHVWTFSEQLVTELLCGSCETPLFEHWATTIASNLFGNSNFLRMKTFFRTSSNRTGTKALESQILNFLEDQVRTAINQLANSSFSSSTLNTKSSSNLIN